MKKLLFFLLPFIGIAQIPSYYDGVNFSIREDIESELSDLTIAKHTTLINYTPGVWNTLLQSDLNPADSTTVLLIYGNNDTDNDPKNDRTRSIDLRNTGNCGSCIGRWEREHVYPQSLAVPRMSTSPRGPGTDAHNLRAVDRQMNSSRSNYPYTDSNGNAALVGSGFYPGDEWIGDVARIIMYMHIRYNEPNDAIGTLASANSVAWNSTNTANPNMPDLFLKWNAMDPPSEYELVRNEVISEVQGNRNPFIDNPYLATLAWGGEVANNTWGDFLNTTNYVQEEITVEVTPNPTSDFVNINAKQFKSANLYNIEGMLIQSDLKNKFSIAQYPAGVYILVIHLEDGRIVTKKVIKK
ncbi:endonuclease [Faecalibacter macacae]|uniref:T9SS C-terminal target domain-containing protein n=1 Tax=Faecalibacter macacae TaxID=1859289 RepID=A0A3L9MGV4_9FLAO|nr:endonuclease [Faecalibacter macacae]RLZ12300.1 T9SS C-terminal target domain-containing protein [Faecalibacter macacae]